MSQKGYSSYCRLPKKGNSEMKAEKMSFLDLTEESMSESQNFQLLVSQGSSIEEFTNSRKTSAAKIDQDNDIIVLSDSSSTPSPKALKKSLKQKGIKTDHVLILDSSISNVSSSEDERFFQNWKSTQRPKVRPLLPQTNNINSIREASKLLTSDETSSAASGNEGRVSPKSTRSSSATHVSPTQESISRTNSMIKSFTKLGKGHFEDRKLSSSSSTHSEPLKELETPNKSVIRGTRNISSSSRKLTKKEVLGIIKTVRSARAVYESPGQYNKDRVIIDETLDDDLHPALSPAEKLNYKAIINETPPNSTNNIISTPQVKNPPEQPDVQEHTGLSSRKTKQVAQWLMSNSPDSRSDSSFSCVPPSNRSSLNSGNSSLERLELNYETPNNRDKVRKAINQETSIADQTESKKIKAPGKSSIKSNRNKKVYEQVNQDVNMCNTLRDNAWKTRMNMVQPASEPRRQQSLPKDRHIQTERKNTSNQRKNWIDDSHEDDSDSSFHDIRPQVDSKSKTVRRTKKKNDSFINDNSSSESDGESLYYTALTVPRQPKTSVSKLTPQVQRALALCDSETDEDKASQDTYYTTDVGRKRLEYSDDEDDIKSSTSEFDPGDDVPPKPVSKTILPKETKTPRQAPKPKVDNRILSTSKPPTAIQSFLASLSDKVPLAQAHPDAKKYRSNFKNTKDDLCQYLFKLYNEKVFDNQLPHDMPIEWNVRMRGTAGYCYNKKSVKTLGGIARSSRIVLATKILDTGDRLRDTLIHEMCHAAAWLINEVSDGHGPFWTAWASKAMKTFPEIPPIRRCHDYEIKTKFTYKCTSCGYSIGRHSKSLDVERKRCGHCYGKFELLINKTTKTGTVQVQTPKRAPSAFALFVKENYHSVKKERNVKHAEIMKILSGQFSVLKLAKQNDNDKENCPE